MRSSHPDLKRNPDLNPNLPSISAPGTVRIDKWLWAARVFKTRRLACESCRKGMVTICGQAVKPSRDVRINDIIVVRKESMTHTFRVLGLLAQRVSAQVARGFIEDQTPPSEYAKAREASLRLIVVRPKGAGRPTKKERRAMDAFRQLARGWP